MQYQVLADGVACSSERPTIAPKPKKKLPTTPTPAPEVLPVGLLTTRQGQQPRKPSAKTRRR
ncbi:MAG: hypothetical protein AB7S38_35975 [Vulcanimicrobiota bacterium]